MSQLRSQLCSPWGEVGPARTGLSMIAVTCLALQLFGFFMFLLAFSSSGFLFFGGGWAERLASQPALMDELLFGTLLSVRGKERLEN